MTALHAFLGELIDDAGLFPPARLPLAEALAAHARAQAGDAYWVQGRFVVPASLLGALRESLDDSPDPFPVSVVLDTEPAQALAAIAHQVHRGRRVAVEALEVKATAISGERTTRDFEKFAEDCSRIGVPAKVSAYIEVALDDDVPAALTMVRDADAGERALYAKVRCGGPHAGAVPPVDRLADFIVAAYECGVAFKATAGLHHPLAERGDDGVARHGFLNVIGGAVLVHAGRLDRDGLVEVLRDGDRSDFALDDERFAWDGVAVDANTIGKARAAFVHSYGSCSFEEPVEDLCALGILGSPVRRE